MCAAFGYTLAVYSNAEEALFNLLLSVRPEDGPKLLKTASVFLPMESEKTTEGMLQAIQRQIGPYVESNGLLCEACRGNDLRRGAMIACLQEGQADDFDAVLTSGRAGLIVKVCAWNGRLAFRGAYRTDVFCGSFIKGFLKCFAQVLSEMMRAEKPDEISFMDQDAFEPYDRANQTSVPVEIVSVNRLFERQAQLHPDKTAVIAAGETLTFDQLNRLANRAAHGLRALGVGKDRIVGMVLDRTKEIFIAEHAILKAGGAFLPLVPEYPDERIRYCLEDAQSSCVITTEAIKAARPALFSEDSACKVLTVEALIQNNGEENLSLAIEPDSLAYCIYTSGSTGKPKGVMIEHRNMCNYLNANPRHPAIYWHTQNIRTALSVTSISFDMSITERFVSLCNGVTLCMATLDEIHDPLALARLMNAHHVESIVCTPSYLMSLLEISEMHRPIAALKAYHVGGEAFPSTLISRLEDLNPNSHVINGYGPTETSVCCTSSEVLPDRPSEK